MIDTPSEDVEEVLDRFRRWLEAARREADAPGPDRFGAVARPDGRADVTRPEFGLIQLAEEFTALRHELKLQTKSGRGLIDQAESTVTTLRQAIEQFRTIQPREAQAAWTAGRPIAEALGDLDEALTRGRREVERISRRLAEDTTLVLADAVDERFRGQPWFRRLLTADFHRQVQNVVRAAGWQRRELLDALLEGYGLIHARLVRVMASEQIERIPCEGRPVDPERMTVIEVVDDPDRPPGTVIKELRSGYTWKGRLLRYAEVQAASVVSGANLPASASGRDGEDVDDSEDNRDGDDGDVDPDHEDEEDEGVDLDVESGGAGAGRPRSY